MINERGRFFVLTLLAIIFSFALVSATGVTLSTISSSEKQVNIQNAELLYAYEVNFDHSGEVTAVTDGNYLTVVDGDSQYGYNTRGAVTSVYGSRLDNTAQGATGNGNLFNITYTGTLSLRYALFVYINDSREYIYYNNTAAAVVSPSTTNEGGGGGGSSVVNKTKITVVKDNNPATESPGMEAGLGGSGNATTTGKIISDIPQLKVGNTIKSLIKSVIEFFIRLFGGAI